MGAQTRPLVSACIFCEGTFGAGLPRSHEHIWPEWMHDHFAPGPRGTQQLTDLGTGRSLKRRMPGELKHSLKPKVVCRPCNNGWMNELETAVRPTLESMMLSTKSAPISRAALRTVATWFAMKNMVAEWSDPPTRATGAVDYRAMFKRPSPPSRTYVWVARAEDSELRYHHHGIRLRAAGTRPSDRVRDPPANTQVVSFAVGHVALFLFSYPWHLPLSLIPEPTDLQRTPEIFPATPSRFRWPLREALTPGEVVGFAAGLGAWLVQQLGAS